MDCNRDEALRAKEIAEKKLSEKDITGAIKFAVKAQNLDPGLDGISQMMSTLDVYTAAEKKVNGAGNWYGILGLDPVADEDAVRKQFRKLALTLHPDKNKTIGAEGAFQIISEAWSLLSDKNKKLEYDQKIAALQKGTRNARSSSAHMQSDFTKRTAHMKVPKPKLDKVAPSSHNEEEHTFWTVCHQCKRRYKYLKMYLNKNILCAKCHVAFFAVRIPCPSSKYSKRSIKSQQHKNKHQDEERKKAPSTNKGNPSIPNGRSSGTSTSADFDTVKRRRVSDDLSNKTRREEIAVANPSSLSGHGNGDYGPAGGYKFGNSKDVCHFSIIQLLVGKARKDLKSRLNEQNSSKFATIVEIGKQNSNGENIDNGMVLNQSKCTNKLDTGNQDSHWTTTADYSKNRCHNFLHQLSNVPDSEFHRFGRSRSEETFEENQVWDAFDGNDGEKDAPSVTFKWTVEGFSRLTRKKYSEIFYVGGIAWRLLIFPKGNAKAYLEGNKADSLSVYLDVADSETKSRYGWSIYAKLSLIVINQIHDKLTLIKDTQHRFDAKESYWGFTSFMRLTDLYDPDKGYLVKDTCIIEATVTVESVVPPKKTTKTPLKTQSRKRKENSLYSCKELPGKKQGSNAHTDPTDSAMVAQFEEPPNENEGSSAPSVVHNDPTDSAKVTQPEEPPKKIDVSSNEKSPAKGNVIEENTRSVPLATLFSRLGPLKVRNPPYSLPNGYRITEGTVLDEGAVAAQLIQSSLLSKELQPLVEMPMVDLANQGYFYLAKGLQIKHQEHANVLEEIKSRDLEIHELQLYLGKSAQEASKLRGDLEKAKEEKAKVAGEFSAAKEKINNLEGELHKVEDELSSAKEKIINLEGERHKVVDEFSSAEEKIINLEGELQLLRNENIDLQIQLEDARRAETMLQG